MRMQLTRVEFGEDYTLGQLVVRDKTYFTMEDKVREIEGVPVSEWKIKNVTAIPRGSYKVIMTFSNRFKKELPLLVDVPGYTGVRIHAGNTAVDTEGCLLVGTGRAKGGYIINSRAAVGELLSILEECYDRNEEVWIDIA